MTRRQHGDGGRPARPLAGLTVVELGTYVAAPSLGNMLGMLGARVLKV